MMPLLCWLLAGAGLAPSQRPRLVVVVTVDQLRPDYLDRYRTQFLGGLRLLLKRGAVFTDAYQDHAVTETAPGHATILAGRWPAHTGIIRNAVGVQDSTAPLLGVAGPGASPARFRGTTLFDWLKTAEPRARALSVSRKDRGAILPLGSARQQVYWYQAGVFTTSRYYADSLPAWVRAFNARRIPFQVAGRAWTLLLPERAYPEPDSVPYENGGHDVTFPHRLPADSAQAARALAGVPTMDSLTLAFALEGVRALELGARGATDLLAVSLSTTDAVGHAFGPDSREIHDQVVRLDRYLGWFFEQLFVRYGTANVLIVLTADHGVTPFPERSTARGHPGAVRVAPDSLIDSVNAALDRRVGGARWLEFDTGVLFVPDRPRLAAQGVNVDSVLADLAPRLRNLPGVARVDRPVDLARRDTADPVVRRWVHAIPPDAAVELVVTLKPYCVWSAGTERPIAMHGQPTEFDAHVPLLLWGRGVKRGVYPGRVSTVDIAPTLARLLGVTPSEPLDGRVLAAALEPERADR
ncbi:MAG TPA: alkaline phosphatase family protein [Gemmatimonadales bacterium]|jgi:predicted AlkP superfamily pyrophosphatase or phosphodiesterase|nr:alkaline phosphatase family protein [Gemmatimonadales bacterium]